MLTILNRGTTRRWAPSRRESQLFILTTINYPRCNLCVLVVDLLLSTACTRSLSACEAGAEHKAWGVSPRNQCHNDDEPVKRATDLFSLGFRPLSRAQAFIAYVPGANAPGFMLDACFAGLAIFSAKPLSTINHHGVTKDTKVAQRLFCSSSLTRHDNLLSERQASF